MDFAKRSVAAGDCQIHYLEAGTGDAVVMLHGAGGLRVDERAFSALAQRFRLLVPSMPGFDESTPGSATSLPDVADVMAEFVRTTAGRAAVIGESFGGAVASWLAIRHPEVVERLVLAAPGGLVQSDGPRLGELSPAEMNVILFGRPPSENIDPAVTQQRQRNRANARRLISARAAFDPELQEQLAAVQAPTLVLWGSEDRMIFPSQAKYFVEAIPNAQLHVIEGAPHVLSAAVPEEFLAAVFEFFASVEPTAVPSS